MVRNLGDRPMPIKPAPVLRSDNWRDPTHTNDASLQVLTNLHAVLTKGLHVMLCFIARVVNKPLQ